MSGKKVEIVSAFDELYQLLLLHKVTYHGRDISYLKKSEIADLLIDHGAATCFSFVHEATEPFRQKTSSMLILAQSTWVTFKSSLGFRYKHEHQLALIFAAATEIGLRIYKAAVRAEEELKRPRASVSSPQPTAKGDKKEKFLQQLEGLGVFTETERDLVEFFVEHGTRAVKPIYLDYPPDDATDCCVPWCGDREKGVRIRPLKFTFPKFDRQLEAIERCIRDFFLSDG